MNVQSLNYKLQVFPDYLGIQKVQRDANNKFDKMKLNEKQMKAVDRAITAANANGWAFGSAAYRLDFQDALKLISELKQFF